MQALASSCTLLEILRNGDGLSSLTALSTQVFTDLQPTTDTRTRSKSCQTLLSALRSVVGEEHLPSGTEHDAAEGLQLLLDAVQDELNAYFRSNTYRMKLSEASLRALLRPDSTPARHADPLFSAWRARRLPCEGLMATQMQCLRCMHTFETQHMQFTILTLPIPIEQQRHHGVGSSRALGTVSVPPGISLGSCLELACRTEVMSGVHCPSCSIKESMEAYTSQSCARSEKRAPLMASWSESNSINLAPFRPTRPGPAACRAAQAVLTAAQLPYTRTLCTVLRRTVVSRWPPLLIMQLRRTVWSPASGHIGPQQIKVCGRVRFPFQFTPPVEAAPEVDGCIHMSTPCHRVYSLVAVIVHTGLSPTTGHYITYRRIDISEAHGGWVRVSDESVVAVDEEQVTASHATLLFYEAVDNQGEMM